jgi:hypothetical protein
MKLCSVEDCDRESRARGWCLKHYQRWSKNGHPTIVPERKPRRDAAGHGTRRRYDLGCRCLPCAIANSRYQSRWKHEGKTRVPAEEVAAYLKELIDSGWTQVGIAEATDLGKTTPWYILAGRVKSVNPKVAERIFALEPFSKEPVWLPAEPLVKLLSARGTPYALFSDQNDRRAYHRAKETGKITEQMADRLAIKGLGLSLEEVYGFDLLEVG